MTSRLALEVGVAREEPAPVRPRPQGVLAQPAPDGRQADRLDDLALDRLAGDVGDRQARERQTRIARALTGEGLDLDHHPRGEKVRGRPDRGRSARPAARSSKNRLRQRLTVVRTVPSRSAISSLRSPSAASTHDLGPEDLAPARRLAARPALQRGSLLGRQLDPVGAPSRHRLLLSEES